MKQLFYALIASIICFSFTACTKTDLVAPTNINLAGKWSGTYTSHTPSVSVGGGIAFSYSTNGTASFEIKDDNKTSTIKFSSDLSSYSGNIVINSDRTLAGEFFSTSTDPIVSLQEVIIGDGDSTLIGKWKNNLDGKYGEFSFKKKTKTDEVESTQPIGETTQIQVVPAQ